MRADGSAPGRAGRQSDGAGVTVLALDTTTKGGSVAVVQQGLTLAELPGDPQRTHGERLPEEFARALGAAGLPLSAVTLLAVAAGPGSFTGLRVGIAAMQGLAMSTGLRIVPISALDALARVAARGPGAGAIAAWMDAQRGQVFATLYDEAGERALTTPSAQPPMVTLEGWAASLPPDVPVRFVGDGAVRYADLIERHLGPRAIVLPPPPPLAAVVGALAAENPAAAVLPHAVVPIYIRRPDAELARLKRTTGA